MSYSALAYRLPRALRRHILAAGAGEGRYAHGSARPCYGGADLAMEARRQ